jgi:hypothetical protein
MPTSGSKEERALPFSTAVNNGQVEMLELPETTDPKTGKKEDNWNRQVKKELRDFPLSEWKDIVDSGSDCYNKLFQILTQGTVVKNFKWQRNFITVSQFLNVFTPIQKRDTSIFHLPDKFAVYAAVKINQDASKPTSAVIVARAPQYSVCPEDLFVLDEYKRHNADMYGLFDWLKERLAVWKTSVDPVVYLHGESEQYYQTIASKLPYAVTTFKEDNLAGHNEMNWYLMPHDASHPFKGSAEQAGHLYFVCADGFYHGVGIEHENTPQSFYHSRQEIKTWGYNLKGEPTQIGQVLDCLRIICHRFKTYAETYSREEEIELTMKKYMPYDLAKIQAEGTMTPAIQQRMAAAQMLARMDLEEKYGKDYLDEDTDPDFLWFMEEKSDDGNI